MHASNRKSCVMQARASSIVFENSYFHDSLGAGIIAKGAKATVIRNNVVERAGYRGAAVGFDPYWQEGGVPSNVLIEVRLQMSPVPLFGRSLTDTAQCASITDSRGSFWVDLCRATRLHRPPTTWERLGRPSHLTSTPVQSCCHRHRSHQFTISRSAIISSSIHR